MSLAQLLLDGVQLGDTADEIAKNAFLEVRSCISQNFSPNHMSVAHPSLSVTIASETMQAAQRFTVDGIDCNDLTALGTAFLAEAIPLSLPATRCWIEFPITSEFADFESLRAKVGVYIKADSATSQSWNVHVFSDLSEKDLCCPILSGYIKRTGSLTFDFHASWSLFDEMNGHSRDWSNGHLAETAGPAIQLLAALNVPRSVLRESVVWQPAIQKARLKRGKHPLLSFNQVKLKLPKTGMQRSSTMQSRLGIGVRFHGVLGHLRRVEKPSGPELSWIRPYFRGDARLGIVVKDRKIESAH